MDCCPGNSLNPLTASWIFSCVEDSYCLCHTFNNLKFFWTTLFILRVILVPVFGMQKMLQLYSFLHSFVLLSAWSVTEMGMSQKWTGAMILYFSYNNVLTFNSHFVWWEGCVWKSCNQPTSFSSSRFHHMMLIFCKSSRLNLRLITDLSAEWKCV